MGAGVAGASLWAWSRRGRDVQHVTSPLELPPAPEAAEPDVPASDEPLVRETRFDQRLDEEEQRRHAAAQSLKDDPLVERTDDDDRP